MICQGKTVYLCTWKSAKLYVKENVPLCVSHQNDMLYAKEKGYICISGEKAKLQRKLVYVYVRTSEKDKVLYSKDPFARVLKKVVL